VLEASDCAVPLIDRVTVSCGASDGDVRICQPTDVFLIGRAP
jgi:predicted RNA-binding protein with PUA domain